MGKRQRYPSGQQPGRKARKAPHTVGGWIWRLMVWFVLAVLAYQAYLFAGVVWYRWFDPQHTAFIADEQARLSRLTPPRAIEQTWVPYDDISRYAKRAVISAEDTGFVEHSGIEWQAIERAARANLESGEIRRGGSTITMQVAKNLFLSSDRSYIRKAQELIIAMMIELVWSKQRTLEVYLNIAEWGVGVFGIETAAKHYFGVPASRLSPRQAAWLAAILPAPRRYDQDRGSAWIQRKTGIILRRMPQVQIP
jgi:monofunctional biosynthetic peptidoglycan transglycosylase